MNIPLPSVRADSIVGEQWSCVARKVLARFRPFGNVGDERGSGDASRRANTTAGRKWCCVGATSWGGNKKEGGEVGVGEGGGGGGGVPQQFNR